MQELVDWTRQNLKSKETHPLLVISHFVSEFLAIHPFQDGNGRLSRALTTLLLLQEGYSYVQYVSLEQIVEEKKEDYYITLRKSQKNREKKKENIYPWLQFIFDALIEQTHRAQNILERRNVEEELSENQLTVLNLLRSNKTALSVKQIVEKTKINRNTVKKVLERLKELRLIKQTGLGRASRWKLI